MTDQYLAKVRENAELLNLKPEQEYSLDQDDLVIRVKGELQFIKQINRESYERLLTQYPILASAMRPVGRKMSK